MPRTERITIDVDSRGTYPAFIRGLRGILAEHDDNPRLYVRDQRDRSIHYVLPKQKYPRKPERWMYIKLVLSDDGAETTLAVRDDNVYLIGFKNKRGEWFEFGFSGTMTDDPIRRKSRPMLEEGSSRFLECDVNYGSLLPGGARSFVGMPLGRSFARFAVSQLSGYSQGEGGTVDDATRCALAGLMVTVCEAARMRPLEMAGGWHADCCCIGRNHVDYIWGWGDMSEALLRWERNPVDFQFPECLKDIGVGGASKALDIVELLLNTPIIHRPPRWRLDQWRQQRPAAGDEDDARRSEQHQRRRPSETLRPAAAGEHGSASGSGQQQPPPPPPNKRRRTEQQQDQPPPPSDKGSGESQHSHQQEKEETPAVPADDYVARGRPLVEVFAVRAAGFHFVGTIAVFDGMRGQVIYENNNGGAHGHGTSASSRSGYAPLLLTGPYRAISAYGSFTIEVNFSGATTSAGPSSTDVGELNWDCYDEEKVYDRPVAETITTRSSGRKVEVTYAVLSDAVDAELQVHLRLPGATADGGRGAVVVYGRIATRSKAFHDQDQAWSVLFDSEVEGVSLVAAADDDSGSMARLPLARSVVAMPLGSPLVIMATLYDAPPSQHGVSPIFQCLDMELTLDDHMRSRSTVNGGQFEVSITSPDRYLRLSDTATPRPMPTNHYAGCY